MSDAASCFMEKLVKNLLEKNKVFSSELRECLMKESKNPDPIIY